jgi:hypothetical protein
MPYPGLKITLTLDRNECVRGESVGFTVVAENTSGAPIPDFPKLIPLLETVTLTAESSKGGAKATQMSARRRNGEHPHGPRTPVPGMTLARGQKLELRGDLLEWFGELEPGKYQIQAAHAFEEFSEPAPLTILPAKPGFASLPRYAGLGQLTPMPGTWTHVLSEKESLPFYQIQSPSLPRNVLHCYRTPPVAPEVQPQAALIGNSDVTAGHLVWLEKPGRLVAVTVDLNDPKKIQRGVLELGGDFRLLQSPLSMPGPELWAPLVTADGSAVSLRRIDAQGAAQAFGLELTDSKPLGPYVCFWESGERLVFAWTAERGREVRVARLPLRDPGTGFVKRSLLVSDDPILWIEGFIDNTARSAEAPMFESQVPPEDRDKRFHVPPSPVVLICVALRSTNLHFTRVNVADEKSKVFAVLPADRVQNPRCISAAVTYEQECVLLLADAKDELYLASTKTGRVSALSEAANAPVKLSNHPTVVAATRSARSPWVHLRYIAGQQVRYVRLEPVNEQDPIERGEGPGTTRT